LNQEAYHGGVAIRSSSAKMSGVSLRRSRAA
jgi:hypothetical protein